MFCKQLLFPQYLHTNLVHFQRPMKIVQFPAKMNSKMGPTMGRALIGCCPMATANRSSPHSGPILSVLVENPLNTHCSVVSVPFQTMTDDTCEYLCNVFKPCEMGTFLQGST